MNSMGANFSPDKKYRYRLWRYWGRTGVGLMWIMLNPSTADETLDDPTIRRCIGYSMNNGFPGCEIYNLFAFRSTNPSGLLTVDDPVGPENDWFISHNASIAHRPIVCAWGNVHKKLLYREEEMDRILRDKNRKCLKRTACGAPAHPLYLSSKLPFIPYNIQ